MLGGGKERNDLCADPKDIPLSFRRSRFILPSQGQEISIGSCREKEGGRKKDEIKRRDKVRHVSRERRKISRQRNLEEI